MPEPIPILMLVHELHVGGNERDLAKLARSLNPREFQVHVAAFHAQGDRRAELDAQGIPVIELKIRSFRNLTYLAGARQLRAYIRQHGIRVIHAFDAPSSIFAIPLGRLWGVEALISSHAYFRDLIPAPNHRLLRLVDWLAHRIVVNAEAIKRHLITDYRLKPERIYVCYNSVETDVFAPRAAKRPEYLTGAPLVIGALCVLREEKRIGELLEAFAKILPQNPALRLLIVGDGPMRETWLARRDALGIAGACRFEQTTSQVPYWLNCMDIFVLASRSEGFPNTVLEAMASGCAVAASRVGGVPEMIEDGRTGLLFTPGGVNELAETLGRLVSGEELRNRLRAAAPAAVREQFSVARTRARMEQLYQSLLREKS